MSIQDLMTDFGLGYEDTMCLYVRHPYQEVVKSWNATQTPGTPQLEEQGDSWCVIRAPASHAIQYQIHTDLSDVGVANQHLKVVNFYNMRVVGKQIINEMRQAKAQIEKEIQLEQHKLADIRRDIQAEKKRWEELNHSELAMLNKVEEAKRDINAAAAAFSDLVENSTSQYTNNVQALRQEITALKTQKAEWEPSWLTDEHKTDRSDQCITFCVSGQNHQLPLEMITSKLFEKSYFGCFAANLATRDLSQPVILHRSSSCFTEITDIMFAIYYDYPFFISSNTCLPDDVKFYNLEDIFKQKRAHDCDTDLE